MEANFVEACAAGSTMRGQLEAAERQVTVLERQLADTGTVLKELESRESLNS